MEQNFKKKIAKEVLYLSGFIFLSLFIFVFILGYNKFFENKSDSCLDEIHKIKMNPNIGRTNLDLLFECIGLNDHQYIPPKKYSKDIYDFVKIFDDEENLELLILESNEILMSTLNRPSFETYEDFKSYYLPDIPKINSRKELIEQLVIYENKRDNYNSKIISNDGIKYFFKWFFISFLLLLYPLRLFVYILRWAYKIVFDS